MSIKLRDFIRLVRSCKTAAEERSVIAKECALIRIAFKEGDAPHRQRNVAKLLFIHLMGYPTHFGQLECLKLIASPRFSEKRIGYLGLNQVLDEDTEILMLVTNSIKNDLHHASQYVISLGLAALANIASSEMCRALAKEVEDLCSSSNPYIRKKALLCAIRLLKRVEDTSERFVPIVSTIFEEKNHGVLLAGCALVQAIVEVDPSKEVLEAMRKEIPQIVKALRRIVFLSGYSTNTEYDVSGVVDPFLQASLTRTLRILYKASPRAPPISSEMQDVLAQIASTTEISKSAGNAVLFECALTIMAVPAESSLKSLGLTILGRFIDNRDSNIRYVGLASLQQLIKHDAQAVKKHYKIVLECLRDPDTSLRRIALEVLFQLVDRSSIEDLFKELTALLAAPTASSPNNAENAEFKKELVSKLCTAINNFSPTRRWQIDSMIKVFTLEGRLVPIDSANAFIVLLMQTHSLQAYAAHKLYLAVKENPRQEQLTRIAVWAIGEFGDLLIGSLDPNDFTPSSQTKVSPDDVLSLLEGVAALSSQAAASASPPEQGDLLIGYSPLLEQPPSPPYSELLLSCLIKLSSRFPERYHERLTGLVSSYKSSLSIELQQRACEFSELLQSTWDSETRGQLFDRIPAPEAVKQPLDDDLLSVRPSEDVTPLLDSGLPAASVVEGGRKGGAAATDGADLLSLLDESTRESGGRAKEPDIEVTSGAVPPPVGGAKVENLLLADLFANQGQPQLPSAPTPAPPPASKRPDQDAFPLLPDLAAEEKREPGAGAGNTSDLIV